MRSICTWGQRWLGIDASRLLLLLLLVVLLLRWRWRHHLLVVLLTAVAALLDGVHRGLLVVLALHGVERCS